MYRESSQVAINWTSMVPDRLLALYHNFASFTVHKIVKLCYFQSPQRLCFSSWGRSHSSTGALPLDPTKGLPSLPRPLYSAYPLLTSWIRHWVQVARCQTRSRIQHNQSNASTAPVAVARGNVDNIYLHQASLVVSATTETQLIDIKVHSVHGEGLQPCIP